MANESTTLIIRTYNGNLIVSQPADDTEAENTIRDVLHIALSEKVYLPMGEVQTVLDTGDPDCANSYLLFKASHFYINPCQNTEGEMSVEAYTNSESYRWKFPPIFTQTDKWHQLRKLIDDIDLREDQGIAFRNNRIIGDERSIYFSQPKRSWVLGKRPPRRDMN